MCSTIFMCGELKNVEKIFYFGVKGLVFDVLKKVCISGFKNIFLPEIVLITLRAVGLQIKISLAFWKSLDV